MEHLANEHDKERLEHPLQRLLEDIVEDVLTELEVELFYMRFGEGLSYREIAKQMGYSSHQTFQLKINAIMKKVREAVESRTDQGDIQSDH